METNNTKKKEVDDNHDLHTIRELDEEQTIPLYADTSCKMGKEWEFSWHLFYQLFTKGDYAKLPLDDIY